MRNMFDAAVAGTVARRIGRMQPDDRRRWGTMSPAQALAHSTGILEMALGERRPPRHPIGRVIGWAIKRMALGNDAPMPKNAATVKEFVVLDDRDFETERTRLLATIDRFVTSGPLCCTDHPHPFFGRLTPAEWAVHQYKHLDHHLRQFGR
jgi:hypothetical protein